LKIGLAEKVADMQRDALEVQGKGMGEKGGFDGGGEERVGWEKVNGDFKL
jgi:hypothetical protein